MKTFPKGGTDQVNSTDSLNMSFVTGLQQEAHQLVGRQNAAALEFDPKPSEAAFSTVFRCSFRAEVVSDVISGMVDQNVGMDICANFGDSRLKLS